MAANLKVTKYNDGVSLAEVTGDAAWAASTTAAYSWYDNIPEAIDYIYNLKEALDLGIADISELQAALDALVPAVAGKGLSTNDLTDDLLQNIADAVSHMAIENIHLPPDGVTIQENNDNQSLEVIKAAIVEMFAGVLPLSIDEEGNISLAIDDATLAVVDGKLTVIGSADTKLAFDPETSMLSINPAGATEVDLSSLGGGGSVDLSNYVKKTGATSQTIEGDLITTGDMEAYG
jgi:hypothetical protein